MRYPGRTAGVSTKECRCLAGQVLIGKANDNRETDMNRLKEKLHRVKQHWKQTRGALVTESTTLEDASRVTKNLYRYLDVFDLGGSQSVSTGNIKEGDGTYTGFFSGMNADNIEVVKHHVNNYIVYQTYEVEVHYKLKFPWKFIFNDERIYIPMIARAEVPVTDSAEFSV